MPIGFKVQQVDHVEVFVPSRRTAARWYGEILGLSVVERYEHWAADPGGPLMLSSDGGNTKLALFRGEPRGRRPVDGQYLVAFRVDGVGFGAFLERLEDHPVFDNRGRQQTRADAKDHGQAFSIYFNDPYGNRYEVTTYDHDQVREILSC